MSDHVETVEAGGDCHARRVALRFIVLIGFLSFFADFTYEGSRSIIGPYLAMLQASGTVVGIVTGFGELMAMACGSSQGDGRMPPGGIGRSRYSAMSCRWPRYPHWH
jgi:hypothetical protein